MRNEGSIKSKYRPEIDGLRAFAVIAVIINHFNKEILPSGYLGVDIFFVISGYVITSSLAGRKSLSFWDFVVGFYERRIKRLVPALVFFVLVGSIFICFFNSDPEFSLRTGITSLFGFSNIYLLKQSTDYFAASTDLNVFTHTWSLGVEEQFYFVFPLLIWFTGYASKSKRSTRNLYLCTLFLMILSFVYFIYLYPTNQSAAYFLMPSRFWEMAMGCFLFLTIYKKGSIANYLEKNSPSLILLIMFLVMNLPIKFGLYTTTLIVLLTALLIPALKKETLPFKFFTSRKVVHIGLISYSLYLWHWGILSISRWTIGIHWWSIPFQIILIYLLATLSNRFIETPFRKLTWSNKMWETIFKGILVSIFTGLTLLGVNSYFYRKLFLGQNIKSKTNIKWTSSDLCAIRSVKEYSIDEVLENCLFKKDENKQTFFWVGDSHSDAMSPGINFISEKTNTNLFHFSAEGTTFPSIKYFRTDSKDQFLYSYDFVNSIQEKLYLMSKKNDIFFITLRSPYYFGKDWYEFGVDKFRFFDENGHIISRNSKSKFFEEWLYEIEKFIAKLSKKGVKVVFFTPTPEFPNALNKQCVGQNDQWFNKLSKKNCSYPIEFFNSEEGIYSNIIKKFEKISLKNKNVYLFDSLKYMCPDSKCTYSYQENILFKDDDHISRYAAKYIIAPPLINFLKENKLFPNN